ncbi:hypothetical protein SBRCBS47491_004494 [Sporothrix bragantina]|uniref:Cyanovirin-N domain-containing protein n=1 Tax=Sporothrix bragantina TaxID=671064 RepID=A0ABP0BPG2_9PEZI
MFSKIALGLVGLLFSTQLTFAEFAKECRNICLDPNEQNMLVTECTISGGAKGNPNDSQYQWSEFDLNQILARNGGYFGYQQNGDFSVNGSPCNLCAIDEDAAFTCKCDVDTPLIDLNQYLTDVAGSLCFADADFGPICGPLSTIRRC